MPRNALGVGSASGATETVDNPMVDDAAHREVDMYTDEKEEVVEDIADQSQQGSLRRFSPAHLLFDVQDFLELKSSNHGMVTAVLKQSEAQTRRT